MSWTGYIPGDLLLKMPVREFLREGSIPIYASGTPKEHGSRWAVEDYPLQGLDIARQGFHSYPWLEEAKGAAGIAHAYRVEPCAPSGYFKYRDYALTPFGTHQATIARGGEQYEDYLQAPCGSCCNKMASCKCGKDT